MIPLECMVRNEECLHKCHINAPYYRFLVVNHGYYEKGGALTVLHAQQADVCGTGSKVKGVG
jgi:hypothetical protein